MREVKEKNIILRQLVTILGFGELVDKSYEFILSCVHFCMIYLHPTAG